MLSKLALVNQYSNCERQSPSASPSRMCVSVSSVSESGFNPFTGIPPPFNIIHNVQTLYTSAVCETFGILQVTDC